MGRVLHFAVAILLAPTLAGATTLVPGDIVVADADSNALLRIDAHSGAVSIISSGGFFVEPYGIARELDGSILVMDRESTAGPALIRVDPASGSQTVLASGADLSVAFAVAVGSAGEIFVVNSNGELPGGGEVFRVDPTTGARTLVSSGQLFRQPLGIAIEASGNLLVADIARTTTNSGVIRIDPTTGVQSQIASDLNFRGAQWLAVAQDGGIFVTDFENALIVRVDPIDGGQAVLPADTLTGSLAGIAIEADGNLVVADGEAGVLRVDSVTGATSVVSPDSGGAPGELLNSPNGILVIPYACGDGIDNDSDGYVDFPADPGCKSVASVREDPQCQDGVDNDGDGKIDFDGGASVNGGLPLAPPDSTQCRKGWGNREASGCGIGAELIGLIVLTRRFGRMKHGSI